MTPMLGVSATVKPPAPIGAQPRERQNLIFGQRIDRQQGDHRVSGLAPGAKPRGQQAAVTIGPFAYLQLWDVTVISQADRPTVLGIQWAVDHHRGVAQRITHYSRGS